MCCPASSSSLLCPPTGTYYYSQAAGCVLHVLHTVVPVPVWCHLLLGGSLQQAVSPPGCHHHRWRHQKYRQCHLAAGGAAERPVPNVISPDVLPDLPAHPQNLIPSPPPPVATPHLPHPFTHTKQPPPASPPCLIFFFLSPYWRRLDSTQDNRQAEVILILPPGLGSFCSSGSLTPLLGSSYVSPQ